MRGVHRKAATKAALVALGFLLVLLGTAWDAWAYRGGGTLQDPLDSASVPRFNWTIPTGTGTVAARVIIPFTPTVPDPLDPDLPGQTSRVGYDKILLNNIDPGAIPPAGLGGMVQAVHLCPSGLATPADALPVPVPPCVPLGPPAPAGAPNPLYTVTNPADTNNLRIQLNGLRHVGAAQVELLFKRPCADVAPALGVQVGNDLWGTPPGPAIPDAPAGGLALTLSTLPGPAASIASDGGDTFGGLAPGTAQPLKVRVRNACGLPVAGVPVAWAATTVPDSGGGTVLPPASLTDANGIATATFTTGTTPSENRALAASPLLAGSPVEFKVTTVAIAVDAALSTVTADPPAVSTDGPGLSVITVTLKSSSGAPVPDRSVTLSSNRGAVDTIVQPALPTDADGVTKGVVRSAAAGTAEITAVSGAVTIAQKATIAFLPGLALPVRSTLVASPATVLADGITLSTLTATLRDLNDNPIPGKTVMLASSRAEDTVTQPAGPTNAAGVATGSVRSHTSGLSVLTASVDGRVVGAAVVQFVLGGVSAAQSTVVATPPTVPADGVTHSTVTVTLRDAAGNPIPAKVVSLSSNRAGDVVAPPSLVSDTNGAAAFQVRSPNPGQSVYAATGDGVALTQTASVTFVAITTAVCATGAPNPISSSCDGHFATVALGAGLPGSTIEHIYIDQNVNGATTTFSIGYHYSGTVPLGCTTPVAPQQYSGGHCEIVGTSTVVQARDTALDPDRDGYSTQTELLSGSNPFYRGSTPANRGGGFPLDWDADGYSTKDELIGGSDPFHACSIPPAPNTVANGVPVSLCEGPLPVTPP